MHAWIRYNGIKQDNVRYAFTTDDELIVKLNGTDVCLSCAKDLNIAISEIVKDDFKVTHKIILSF